MFNLLFHTKDISTVENFDFSNFSDLTFFKKFIGESQTDQTLTARSIRNFFSTEGGAHWKIDDENYREKWKNFQW